MRERRRYGGATATWRLPLQTKGEWEVCHSRDMVKTLAKKGALYPNSENGKSNIRQTPLIIHFNPLVGAFKYLKTPSGN